MATDTPTDIPTPTAFKRGDVVKLKGSDALKMTVEGLSGDSCRVADSFTLVVREGEVGCVWFDAAGQLKRDKFPVAALILL